MAAKKHSTVVGVFEDRLHADQAVADLKAAGFRDDQIGVAMRHDREGTDAGTTTEETYAEEGAATGIVAGVSGGAASGEAASASASTAGSIGTANGAGAGGAAAAMGRARGSSAAGSGAGTLLPATSQKSPAHAAIPTVASSARRGP